MKSLTLDAFKINPMAPVYSVNPNPFYGPDSLFSFGTLGQKEFFPSLVTIYAILTPWEQIHHGLEK